MNYKELGKSGVKVSRLILGTWSMGGDYFGSVDDKDSVSVIRTYLEHGINSFDTAEIYGNGRAETVLGNALLGVNRDEYTLISKVFPVHFSWEQMEQSCNDSLKRLHTDYLDTYFLHYPPQGMSVGQVMENVERLKQAGKIRSIGVSNFSLEQLKTAQKYGQVDVVQPCYNLLWRYIDRDLLPYCVEQGIGVIPYSTLAQGLLTGHFKKDTPITGGRTHAALFQSGVYERCLGVTAVLAEIGMLYNKTAAQVCVSWLLQNPNLTAPIVGGTDEKHALQNIDAMNFRLTQEEYGRIDEVSRSFCATLPEYVLFFNTEVKGE